MTTLLKLHDNFFYVKIIIVSESLLLHSVTRALSTLLKLHGNFFYAKIVIASESLPLHGVTLGFKRSKLSDY